MRLGRITSDAYYATADYVSMHNHDTGTSADQFYDYGYFQSNGANVANGNKITYTSPNFGGVVVAFQYGLKETTNRDDSYDLSVNFDAGNLHLGAGGTKFGDDWQVAARGLFTLGDLTFGGYYQYSELEEACNEVNTPPNVQFTPTGVAPGACAGSDGDRHNVRGSLMYVIGATELHANVGWVGDRGNVDDSSAIQYTLGANYNLSKRTKVYAFYTAVDNDDNAAYLANTVGEKAQSFMVGIRHHF